MRCSIDAKSVLIGALSAALILCFVGAVPYAHWQEYGRFQLETDDGHAFVLDSATGQVWSSPFWKTYDSVDPNFHAPKTVPLAREGG